MKNPLPAIILSSMTFSALPMAVQADDVSDSSEQTLDPIVVTATLGPRTVGESLSSVTVVDEETMRSQKPSEFQDILRGQPGISVSGNGSFGKNTSVFTRGTNSDATLLLVDGVRLRSATSGGAPWQLFPMELVERVEIVRGPRSSLYGADAVGGVIQAFTLDPKDGNKGWVEAGAGNFNTQKASAGVSAVAGSTRFSLSGLRKKTDGTAIVTDGNDRGFRNTAGVGRVVHEFDNGGQASALLLQSEGNTEFEGGNSDFLIRTLGLSLDTPVNNSWLSSVQFAESRDESETFGSGPASSVFDTRTRSAEWANTFAIDVHEWVVGTEVLIDEVESTTNFDETSRTNTALFSQLRLNFGPTDVHMSLRVDDNEAFGKEETGSIALGHAFDNSHRLRVSYGTSFKAPTFNDLYFPFTDFGGGFTFSGNPDLKPEKAGSVEVGLSGRYRLWFWDAAVYQLDVEDLITASSDFSTVVNVDEARIRGIELSAGFDMDGWRGSAALTLTDPRDRETDNRLRRRSAQGMRLDLDKAIGAWTVGGSVIAEGYRYDDAANNDRLAGYATVDLRTTWRFAADWSGNLTVTNVLDREYSTARRDANSNYIAAGRHAMLTVRYDI